MNNEGFGTSVRHDTKLTGDWGMFRVETKGRGQKTSKNRHFRFFVLAGQKDRFPWTGTIDLQRRSIAGVGLLFVRNILIAAPLVADCGNGAVSRDKLNIVSQRVQVFTDGFDQRIETAFGKIGAANGAGKKNIPRNGDFAWCMEENDMAGRMTGAVKYLQCFVADGNRIALTEPAVGFEWRAGW